MRTIVQPKLPRIQFYSAPAGEPYRPCNGSEGEFFHAMWCEECDRDKAMNGIATVEETDADPSLYCEILNRSFRSDEALPEWVRGDDGQPKCTAFIPKREPGAPDPLERCPNTLDMFSPALALPEAALAASDSETEHSTVSTESGCSEGAVDAAPQQNPDSVHQVGATPQAAAALGHVERPDLREWSDGDKTRLDEVLSRYYPPTATPEQPK